MLCFPSLNRPLINNILQNTTVTDLAVVKLIHAIRNTLNRHLELLDDRTDIVESSELQHILVDLAGRDQRALDSQLVVKERQVRHLKFAVGDGQWVDGTTWCKDWDVKVPVWLEGSADQQVVDLGTL